MSKEKFRRLLSLSVVCMFLLSASIALMPLAGAQLQQGNQIFTIVLGGMFWGSLLLAYIPQLLLRFRVPKGYKYASHLWEKLPKPLRFNHTVSGAVFFCATAASVLSFVISLAVTRSQGLICYILLAIAVFCAQMLFVCNGKAFNLIVSNKARGGKNYA